MKASKSPSAAKKATVQAVQYVQTVQVVESFEGSENGTNPDVPRAGNRRPSTRFVGHDLEAGLEQFRKSRDLSGEHVNPKETWETEPAPSRCLYWLNVDDTLEVSGGRIRIVSVGSPRSQRTHSWTERQLGGGGSNRTIMASDFQLHRPNGNVEGQFY